MLFRCVIGGIQQMRFCYGHRRFTLYPQSVDSWNLNSDNYTGDFLKRTKALGFDALDGLDDSERRERANYYYGQWQTVRELQEALT